MIGKLLFIVTDRLTDLTEGFLFFFFFRMGGQRGTLGHYLTKIRIKYKSQGKVEILFISKVNMQNYKKKYYLNQQKQGFINTSYNAIWNNVI